MRWAHAVRSGGIAGRQCPVALGVEAGHAALACVRAVVAVSAPLDVTAAGHAMDHGLNRWLYVRRFLHTMRAKARAKWQQYPGLFDLEAALRACTLHAFDDAFTAPLHGFAGVDDYWCRASALPGLRAVRVPALLLNARNDPFVPAASLPQSDQVSAAVTLWQPSWGGHVGFALPCAQHFALARTGVGVARGGARLVTTGRRNKKTAQRLCGDGRYCSEVIVPVQHLSALGAAGSLEFCHLRHWSCTPWRVQFLRSWNWPPPCGPIAFLPLRAELSKAS